MPGSAAAQELSALARLNPAASRIWDTETGVALDLAISQPVPWRVRFLDDPPRLVLDFREVDWAGIDRAPLSTASRVRDLRAGRLRAGWSRLVLELDAPYALSEAEMRTGADGSGPALVRLRLVPDAADAFAARAAATDPPGWALPAPARVGMPRARPRGDRPLTVVLDPGHGGIDPGAEHNGVTEAALMLTFARELKEALLRAGGVEVVLTRDSDLFVPLEARIAIAHAVAGDVFLSLHADATAEGHAQGATIYTLADEATDAAAAALAARHDRDNMLAGVDLTGQDDLIARVLMDLARTDSAPRSDRLAGALVAALDTAGVRLHRVPRRAAAFSVLKSPDIPSVLVELGYLNSPRDFARLIDPGWRAGVAAALAAGLESWALADAAAADLLRQ